MMWSDHNQTHHIVTTIYSPVNWIYFYHFCKKQSHAELNQTSNDIQVTGDFVIGKKKKKMKIMWNFFAMYWLHVTATGNWLRDFVFFFHLKIPLLFTPLRKWMTQPSDNQVYGIKLHDNCNLFQCDQCAVRFKNEKNAKYFFDMIILKSIKEKVIHWKCLCFTSINLRCPIRCGIFDHPQWECLYVYPQEKCANNCIVHNELCIQNWNRSCPAVYWKWTFKRFLCNSANKIQFIKFQCAFDRCAPIFD